MPIPYQAVKDAAPSFAEMFCRRYLSTGKRSGDWWIASAPWRVDKNPSLGVNLKTGKWQDFGKETFGDLTDLLARIDNCPTAEACTRLAQMMGIYV